VTDRCATALGRRGSQLAVRLAAALDADLVLPRRHVPDDARATFTFETSELREVFASLFTQYRESCSFTARHRMRMLAPLQRDKRSDPAWWSWIREAAMR